MVAEQERTERSTFAEIRLFPLWKQQRREEMGCRTHAEEEAICRNALYSPEDSRRREMRHWIAYTYSIAEPQSVQLWAESKTSFLKESTKLGHSLLLWIWPWRLNCKFHLLVVEFIGEKWYLNIWQSEDTASVQVVWGCWAANLHLLRRREAKTLFWAEKPKRSKQTTIHSNEEILREYGSSLL